MVLDMGRGGPADRARAAEHGKGRGHGGWNRAPCGGLCKEKNKGDDSLGSRKRTSRDDDCDDKDHDKEMDDTASSHLKESKEAGKEVAGREEPMAKK